MANSIANRALHAELVNQFEEACIEGRRPAIADLLSDQVADRTALLVDLIDLDMEFRWKANEAIRAEDYLQTYPELSGNDASVFRIVRKEWQLRRRSSQPPFLSEFHKRFPEWAERLAEESPSNVLESWFTAPRLPLSTVQQLYAGSKIQAEKATATVKQRLPASADAEKSRWLAETINALFDPSQSDENRRSLFANDNRALANELFARWASRQTSPPDPAAFFLRMAESIREFLMQQTQATTSGQVESLPSNEGGGTTLTGVLADPKRAVERGLRWDQLQKQESATIYDVKMLQEFGGRTTNEIAAMLELDDDAVAEAIREGDAVLG